MYVFFKKKKYCYIVSLININMKNGEGNLNIVLNRCSY